MGQTERMLALLCPSSYASTTRRSPSTSTGLPVALRDHSSSCFAVPRATLFVDLYVQGHRETYLLTSEQFRDRLGLVLLERTGEAPTTAELKRHIEVLRLKAVRQETPVREVYVRTARVDDRITLTAPTDSWSAFEIDADGGRVVLRSAGSVHAPSGHVALADAQSGGSLETFRNLLNVRDDDDFVLVVAWLLNALRGNGQHPILVQNGGEGAAKTTRRLILQALIDPNCMPLGGLPHSERELRTLVAPPMV